MIECIKQIPSEDTYPIRHKVMWPNKPIDHIILANDVKGIHFGLFKNDILVSVVSLFMENNVAQFRKLATDTKEHNKGYGSRLLSHLISYAEGKNITRIWCNARKDKKEFYLKFGLKTTDVTFCKDGIDYVIMEKVMVPQKLM